MSRRSNRYRYAPVSAVLELSAQVALIADHATKPTIPATITGCSATSVLVRCRLSVLARASQERNTSSPATFMKLTAAPPTFSTSRKESAANNASPTVRFASTAAVKTSARTAAKPYFGLTPDVTPIAAHSPTSPSSHGAPARRLRSASAFTTDDASGQAQGTPA